MTASMKGYPVRASFQARISSRSRPQPICRHVGLPCRRHHSTFMVDSIVHSHTSHALPPSCQSSASARCTSRRTPSRATAQNVRACCLSTVVEQQHAAKVPGRAEIPAAQCAPFRELCHPAYGRTWRAKGRRTSGTGTAPAGERASVSSA